MAVCDKCGKDKPDAMPRAEPNSPTHSPTLLRECVAKLPGREWMREQPER